MGRREGAEGSLLDGEALFEDDGPPPGMSSRERLAWRRARPRPRRASAAAVLALAGALALVPATIWGVTLLLVAFELHTQDFQAVMLLPALVAVVLAASAIALLLRHPAGWWGTVCASVVGLLHELRLAVPLFLALNREHPRYLESVGLLLLSVAGPLVLFTVLLALLLPGEVREAYGVKDRPRAGRR